MFGWVCIFFYIKVLMWFEKCYTNKIKSFIKVLLVLLYLIFLFFEGLIYQKTDGQTDKPLSRCSIQLSYYMDFVVLCFLFVKFKAHPSKNMLKSYVNKVAISQVLLIFKSSKFLVSGTLAYFQV